jgi:hypothetical protein
MRMTIVIINGQQAVGNGAVYVKCFGKQIRMRPINVFLGGHGVLAKKLMYYYVTEVNGSQSVFWCEFYHSSLFLTS